MPPRDFSEVNPNAAYTTAEVAALFRVTVDTVKRWCRCGQLQAVRTNGPYRIPGTAILTRWGGKPALPVVSESQWRKRCLAMYEDAMAS